MQSWAENMPAHLMGDDEREPPQNESAIGEKKEKLRERSGARKGGNH
jgi:hypothetical protein